MLLQRGRREAQPRRPSLGAAEQRGQILARDRDAERFEQALGLSQREREVVRADVDERPGTRRRRSSAKGGSVRVAITTPEVARRQPEQAAEVPEHRAVVDLVEIVEDEHDRLWERFDRFDELRQHRVHRLGGRRAQLGDRVDPGVPHDPRPPAQKRGRSASSGSIESQATGQSRVLSDVPVGECGALARPGGRGDQGEGMRRPLRRASRRAVRARGDQPVSAAVGT